MSIFNITLAESQTALLEWFLNSPSCWWSKRVIPIGGIFALGYLLVVTGLHLFFGEILSWTKYWKAIALRVFFLGVCFGAAHMICSLGLPDMYVTVPAFLWSVFIGLWLATQTRLWYVEGGPPPKLKKFCMRGKVVMVTGANAGIGKETVSQLVAKGAIVVMACRNEQKALVAMDDIVEYHFRRTHIIIDDSQLIFLKLDLADLDSVRNAVNAFLKMGLQLDVLICNAGMMMRAPRQLSKDGFELTMAANLLGHFLLINLLLPKLLETPGSRILNLSSSTYVFCRKGFDFDDMMSAKKPYSMFPQYGQSKLGNILVTRELAKRYDKIRCYAINPGTVRSDITTGMPLWMRVCNFVFAFFVTKIQKTGEQGAYTTVWAACASQKSLPPNGSFLANSALEETTEFAKDSAAATKLWDICEKLVGIKK